MRILCLSVIYSITAMCLSGFDVMENSCIPQPDQDIRKVSPGEYRWYTSEREYYGKISDEMPGLFLSPCQVISGSGNMK